MLTITVTESQRCAPPDYLFRGYMAWCLWGHIPMMADDAFEMRSSSFSDCKEGNGNKSMSRATLKHSAAIDLVSAKLKRGGRHSKNEGAPAMVTALGKVLLFLDQQKKHALEVSHVKMKIELLIRKQDILYREKDRREDRNMDLSAVTAKIDGIDVEMEALQKEMEEIYKNYPDLESQSNSVPRTIALDQLSNETETTPSVTDNAAVNYEAL